MVDLTEREMLLTAGGSSNLGCFVSGAAAMLAFLAWNPAALAAGLFLVATYC